MSLGIIPILALKFLFSLTLMDPTKSAATATNGPPFVEDDYPIIIIGSGLAGHSAAAELLSKIKDNSVVESFGNHKVIVIEKEAKFGGNSMKATSGINGALTDFQKNANIVDNLQDFTQDVVYSATNSYDKPTSDRYNLISQLSSNSANAVNWLHDTFSLDLSKISQCGGHSHPRTHRPPKGPAGNIIVKTVHNTLENDPNIEFRYNTKAIELLTDEETKSVIGVKVEVTTIVENDDTTDEKDEKTETQSKTTTKIETIYASAIILASGGYGNDHSTDGSSLLDKYSEQNENKLPTTNGAWATGDGIKLGEQIGARLIDMSYIQVHPTGFVNPKNRDDSTKFLAPEALRGSGGIVVNNKGERFVSELDLRSNIVNAMKKDANNRFYLILNSEAADIFGPNIGFYAKFGLFKKYDSVSALISDSNSNEFNELFVKQLELTFAKYTKIALLNENDNSVSDEFGKNVFPVRNYDSNKEFYIAEITPVIHYTMGGLQMTKNGEIIDLNGDIIPGLFGAGEVTGGLHGMNRLAGNSLLECVVYGRISANSVINYIGESRKHKLHRSGKTEL